MNGHPLQACLLCLQNCRCTECANVHECAAEKVQHLAALQGFHCPANQAQICLAAVGNPNYGFTSLDNFGVALIMMFQVSSACLHATCTFACPIADPDRMQCDHDG